MHNSIPVSPLFHEPRSDVSHNEVVGGGQAQGRPDAVHQEPGVHPGVPHLLHHPGVGGHHRPQGAGHRVRGVPARHVSCLHCLHPLVSPGGWWLTVPCTAGVRAGRDSARSNWSQGLRVTHFKASALSDNEKRMKAKSV